VPFPHLPKFRISEHKEFVKSNGMDVWLVFFPCVVIYRDRPIYRPGWCWYYRPIFGCY